MAGKVIIIEGLDGVGKSTQVELLKKKYESMGGKVHVHHFPTYNTPQGALVEKFLSGELKGLTGFDVATLYIADFVVTWYSELKQYYDDNYILIFDRYWPSTVLYQSTMNDGNIVNDTYRIDGWLDQCGFTNIDWDVIFLTGRFDTICAQKEKYLKENNAAPDEIEKKTDLLRRIGNHANWCILEYGWKKVNVTRDGVMRTPEDIHEEIFERINS